MSQKPNPTVYVGYYWPLDIQVIHRIAVINNATSTQDKARPAADNTKNKLPLAVSLSILFHLGLFFPAWYFYVPEEASSLGHNQIILLQTSQDKPNPSKHDITQNAQSKATGQSKTNQDTQRLKGEGLKHNNKVTAKHASQSQAEKTKKVTSNQGSQINQSGKSLTPAQSYEIVVQQHLLKNIQNAPYFGKAHINLSIMKSGMAIQVTVGILEGPKAYGEWLKRVVYAANPFPKVPKALSDKGLHSVKIILQHEADQ